MDHLWYRPVTRSLRVANHPGADTCDGWQNGRLTHLTKSKNNELRATLNIPKCFSKR